jgi:hypothetical protein
MATKIGKALDVIAWGIYSAVTLGVVGGIFYILWAAPLPIKLSLFGAAAFMWAVGHLGGP